MTLIQYYLYANLYLLVFWMAYRFGLRNLSCFRSLRIYLNMAPLLSAFLPLLQFSLAAYIGSTLADSGGQHLPFSGIVYSIQQSGTIQVTAGSSLNWTRLVEILLLSGSMLTCLIYAFLHFRIHSVIRRASPMKKFENGLGVLMSGQVSIPFIYFNRIVLPYHISEDDRDQIIAHEATHYRCIHHLDHMLFSLLHAVFWMNPIYPLLRRALKLNHEFQVDRQMISAGADPVSYKLALVRYSAGPGLFALANGLSSTDTRLRLMMINRMRGPHGKWKFYLLIPLFTILFAAFTCAHVEPETLKTDSDIPSGNLSEAPFGNLQEDTLRVEIIDPWEGPEGMAVVWPQKSTIRVLMNRRSEIMIERIVVSFEDVEQRIIAMFNQKIEENMGLKPEDFPEHTDFDIKIVVSKDIAADLTAYESLLDAISSALFKLRDMHSIRLYGGLYKTLTENEQESIDALVPLRIYGKPPKHVLDHHRQQTTTESSDYPGISH